MASCHGNFNCIVDNAVAGAIGGGAGAAAGGPGLACAIRDGAIGGLSEAATNQFISGEFNLETTRNTRRKWARRWVAYFTPE